MEKDDRHIINEDGSGMAENIDIEELIQQNRRENAMRFKADTPVFTYVLIAVNVIVWLAINAYALLSKTNVNILLLDFGAKENLHILSGEYWRFVTPVFLHANIVHLLVNCYSLYVVGIVVERIFGHFKFVIVYFIAGILGNIASFMFSQSMGVGASGAIFGLMGALLYFGLEKPALFRQYFGYNVLITIVINLAYGFSNSGIDNFAHIGGLIGGFLATGIVSASALRRWYLNRFLYLGLTVIIVFSGLYYGFNNTQNKILVKANTLEQLDNEQKWEEVKKTGEEILALGPKNERVKISVLWSLAKAEDLTGDYEKGTGYAKELVAIDPQNGHYLLGILYYDMGNYENSKEELLKAKSLKAGYENIDALLNDIDKKLSAK